MAGLAGAGMAGARRRWRSLVILVREMLALVAPGLGRKTARAGARRHSPATTRRRRAPWSPSCRISSPASRRRRPDAARWPSLEGDIIDGANLVRLAETEILAPLDARAKLMILDAAKRVSLVTAVSPRALVDIAYVVFESGRLIRRLAELYGGRPGTLGFFRLARGVLAHLAVTGAIAAGDDFVHQIVGQGLAARLSAKLGEGVVNGMMTARIGIAAMEITRPLPFSALKRPGMSDFLSALTSFTRKSRDESAKTDFGPAISQLRPRPADRRSINHFWSWFGQVVLQSTSLPGVP